MEFTFSNFFQFFLFYFDLQIFLNVFFIMNIKHEYLLTLELQSQQSYLSVWWERVGKNMLYKNMKKKKRVKVDFLKKVSSILRW